MEYRAVGTRCAVDLDELKLPIPRAEALQILAKKGFQRQDVNLVLLARKRVGKSTYDRGVRASKAPTIVDCSSLVKWLYGQRGIELPRRSIQQREMGQTIPRVSAMAGDLVFVSGFRDYYLDDPTDGVGHVGIVTEKQTVIHAASSKEGVIETPIERFATPQNFRGVRRYIPEDRTIITFETPPHREVERSSDFRWIILQNLK
jgi:hypothetical protein